MATTILPCKQRPQDCIDYEDGPRLEYLWCEGDGDERLSGQTLYLGGEFVDNRFYCIPGHAPRVLLCDTTTDKVTMIGPKWPGKFKWLRGIVVGKIIYGLPCHADSVLRIDTTTNEVTTIPIPYEAFYQEPQLAEQQRKQEWKYHGGSICPSDGKIYTIPQSALHVLCIDPTTDSADLFGPPLEGRWKFYGGVVGHDSAIYGIPHDSPNVLRIHPTTGVTLHGNYPGGGHKWHGAARASNGDIVSVPANADSVLVIRPGDPEPELFEIGDASDVVTGRHRNDNKYKYLGATTGPDGLVYCFPSGSERVLQIDPAAKLVRQVGPNIYDEHLERICQNKYQNGLSLEQRKIVYAIPLAAESVLQIDCRTNPPKVTTWPLPTPYKGLAKFEGGAVAPNGAIYCVPNNHKAILKIEGPYFPEGTTRTTTSDYLMLRDRRARAKDGGFAYMSGIPTVRSSAHRVKYHKKDRKHDPRPRTRDGEETNTLWLPEELLSEGILAFDATRLEELVGCVRSILLRCNSNLVGQFREGSDSLSDFVVPPQSTWRSVNGGQCEEAQRYLSDLVNSDDDFLDAFDKLVKEVILPHFKHRLVSVGAVEDQKGSVTFYYQRPPTIRLQPGPAWSQVRPHNDAEYGHQNGELNFWLPLTDRSLTGVDLWAESGPEIGDYHRIKATPGEVIVFHGSSCRHYVNLNQTTFTRVSMDFRVGVEGWFDPHWEMCGTTDDHTRSEFKL